MRGFIRGSSTQDKRFSEENPLVGVDWLDGIPTKKYILLKGEKELLYGNTKREIENRKRSSVELGGNQSPPILVKNQEYRQKDDFNADKFSQALSSEGLKTEVKLGNCLCKSVCCDKCHKLYYVPKYKDRIKEFDYRRTRHVILTTDRNKFQSNVDALETITGKKSLHAFLRKIERGKKKKIGHNWVWEFEPVKISNALAVLEFYEDGYPHWHFLIEVEKEGQKGMIGGEMLHWAWSYGIVRETYFQDQNHWKNIAGYFADKGYFEKGKEYQTRLPENVKEKINRRVRRITQYYNRKGVSIDEELKPDISEKEAFKEVFKYFEQKAKNHTEEKEEKDFVGYKAILQKCGQKTFISAIVNRKAIEMVVPVPFKILKELIKPNYEQGKGYICTLPVETIKLLEECAEWVRWDKYEISGYHYNDLLDYPSDAVEAEVEQC
jgi:hypothetical protein